MINNKIGYIICESEAIATHTQIISDKLNGKAIAECVLQTADERNRNGRYYDSKELFQIVSKNNLAGVVTFQLALSTKNKVRILDEGVLSNGKQVAEVFSEMIGFRDIWSDEFSGEDSDIKPYKINYKTKEKEDITIKKGDGHSSSV